MFVNPPGAKNKVNLFSSTVFNCLPMLSYPNTGRTRKVCSCVWMESYRRIKLYLCFLKPYLYFVRPVDIACKNIIIVSVFLRNVGCCALPTMCSGSTTFSALLHSQEITILCQFFPSLVSQDTESSCDHLIFMCSSALTGHFQQNWPQI